MNSSCEFVRKEGEEPCGRTKHLMVVTTVVGKKILACTDHLAEILRLHPSWTDAELYPPPQVQKNITL